MVYVDLAEQPADAHLQELLYLLVAHAALYYGALSVRLSEDFRDLEVLGLVDELHLHHFVMQYSVLASRSHVNHLFDHI